MNRIKNYNQLEAKSVELVIDRLPNVNYFCTSAALPGLTANAYRMNSPFSDIKVHGDHVQWQPLIVNFIVDEDLNNWNEIKNWIHSYTQTEGFDQYKREDLSYNDLYRSKISDAILMIPSNKYNIKHKFQFIDVFPIDLTDIIFDVQIDGTPNMICTTTFEYSYYTKM